jgi:FAD:protein FMN transferase
MGYTSITRDRYRLAVAAVTGLATAGSLCATAMIAAEAQADFDGDQAARQSENLATERERRLHEREYAALMKAYDKYNKALADQATQPRVVTRQRRQVVKPGADPTSTVGPGGTVAPEPSTKPTTDPIDQPTEGNGGNGGGGGSDPTPTQDQTPTRTAEPTASPSPSPSPSPMVTTRATLTALGTYVTLTTRKSEDLTSLTDAAIAVLDALDRTCSRFREDSDLTRANRSPGEWVDVDPMLVRAAEVGCDAARQTDGLVNPLLGRQLEQLGYDRDFELLRTVEDLGFTEPGVPDLNAWRSLGLDPSGRVRVPTGTALDLGATAKAWAADLIAAEAAALGTSAIVSLGGDIAIALDPETDSTPHAWPIEITPHYGAEPECAVTLDAGGLATSSPRVRRWRRRGVAMHHVLDPRTGHPAETPWRLVTATGPSATAANIASTMAVVLGIGAPDWLSHRGVTARLVSDDGQVYTTGGWPDVMRIPNDQAM